MILDASCRLLFIITESIISKAVRFDKLKCVVALALKSRKDIVNVQVGACVTIVTFTSGRVVRYRTPEILRHGLNRWDRTGVWALPPGTYYLDVFKKVASVRYVKHKIKSARSGRVRKATCNPRHIEFLRRKRAA